MYQVRRIAGATIAAALAVASLGACGGEAESSSGSTKTSTPSSTVSFTGSPIKVMTIAPKGVQAASFATDEVAKAFAAKVNGEGGIGGRELQVLTCNDKFDPNEAANCAREAVSEKVAAVVGGFSAFGDAIVPVLEAAGIPYLGNVAATANELGSKVSFPLAAGPLSIAALGSAAGKTCDTTAAVLLDVPALLSMMPVAEAGMGGKFDGTIKVPQTTVDFASTAKAMGDYDCAMVALSSNQVAALVASMAQLGVDTRIFSSAGSIDEDLLTKFGSQLEGSVTLSTFPGVEDPAWADARAALPKDFEFINPNLQNTWASLVVLQKVLENKKGDITADTVLKALSSAKSVDTGGLTPPLNLSKPLPVPGLERILNPNVTTFLIKDGKLVQQGSFVNVASAMG